MSQLDRSNCSRPARQEGFTLLELMVAIMLIGVIAALAVFAFNPSKSKGEILFSTMSSVAQAADRFSLDTSCYPYQTNQLFDSGAVSGSTSNSCGSDVSAAWNGPYMKAMSVNASGDITVPQIGPTTALTIGPANPPITGDGTTQVAVIATGVPEAIAQQAMRTCDGGTSAADGTTAASCALGTASNGLNTVELVFGN